jgi:hypothetical protein
MIPTISSAVIGSSSSLAMGGKTRRTLPLGSGLLSVLRQAWAAWPSISVFLSAKRLE